MDSNSKTGNSKGNFIDLERVISAKNPGLVKVLPGFVLSYIKRIIHQDEINKMINDF